MLAVIVLAVALLFPAASQQPQGEPIDRADRVCNSTQ
jgi:hypothetical protein